MNVETDFEIYITNLRECIYFVLGSMEFLNEMQRSTIGRALNAELMRSVGALEDLQKTQNDGKRWTADELAFLQTSLAEAEPLSSWIAEEKLLEMLQLRLRRNIKSLKRKAIELGHARKVDYWLASQHLRAKS